MGHIDDLKLYIYRLKVPGEKEEICYSLPPDLIRNPGEEELFPLVIEVLGSLEKIDHEQWFLSLGISTQLGARCCTCDKKFLRSVEKIKISHFICGDEAKSGVFDCRDLIREELLLESDHFQECDEEGCPERESIIEFLKERPQSRHCPFDHL